MLQCTREELGKTVEKIKSLARKNLGSVENKEFVIATEKGVLDRLQRDYPDKIFHLIKETIVCQNMKWYTLEDIYFSLKNETHEITLDETTAQKATRCIERMFE